MALDDDGIFTDEDVGKVITLDGHPAHFVYIPQFDMRRNRIGQSIGIVQRPEDGNLYVIVGRYSLEDSGIERDGEEYFHPGGGSIVRPGNLRYAEIHRQFFGKD